ncbi:hypothetical protein FHS89_002711 [Rubricella aquisinus]|uniref:Uncharacterized protein n=1 Tax=Rubricella aquisinus TaxID=2028108 RepID=A0A840WPS2_9RHOB|nr:hypothetical protein [Rubricella aquisinus]MBB5516671.1 hypothetical protein [Rubricella aquisinus]
MSLPFLLIVLALGLAGIVLLVRRRGGAKAAPLADAMGARAAWGAAFPEYPALGIIRAESGQAALIDFAGGRGLIWSAGEGTVARVLRPGLLRTCTAKAPGLCLRLNDPDAPMVELTLTEGEAHRWRDLLSPYLVGADVMEPLV